MRKNILFLIGLLVLFMGMSFHCFSQNGFVTIQGKKFYLNGNEFYPVGVNYAVDIVDDGNGGFYPSPNVNYGTDHICYESSNAAGSLQLMKNDFLRMKTMGINSIRIVGLQVHRDPNTDGFTFSKNQTNTGCWPQGIPVEFYPPYSGNAQVNPVCAAFFNAIDQVLSAAYDPANNLDLKITLLTQDRSEATTTAGRVDYANYLAALASNFSTNTSLFAYDLFNEPQFNDYPPNLDSYTNVHNKEEVCSMVNLWRNAVKNNDPNHLVTIGGSGSFDVQKWDPAVMNIDFYSLHVYPNIINSADVNLGINRVLSEIYWASKNINMPWMIGEIAFSASSNGLPVANNLINLENGVDGDYNGQANFANITLAAARAMGAAGYTWWMYHDLYGYGTRGDHNSLIDDQDNFKQPVVSVFQNFNSSVVGHYPSQPGTYYNQRNYTFGFVTGYVVDNNNQPIKDAFVFGYDNNATGELVRTFTKDDGSFALYYQSGHIVTNLEVFATSAISLNVSSFPPIQSNYQLNIATNYNLNENNQVISTVIPQIFTAQNNISSTNFLVLGNGNSGSNVTFKAGGEITLKEFTVQRGGEFHALFGLPQSDCNDNAYMRTSSNSASSVNQLQTYENKSTTTFLLQPENGTTSNSANVFISPNPTEDGSFNVFFQEQNTGSEIIVRDLLGNTILKTSTQDNQLKIDLGENSRGIYFVTIYQGNNLFVKKIIYQ